MTRPISPVVVPPGKDRRLTVWNPAVIRHQEARRWSTDGFQNFAKDYAGLTFRESAAMYAKYRFWGVRQGIIRYDDEPKDE